VFREEAMTKELHLVNVIVVFDTYVVAHNPEEAKAALLELIQQGEPPTSIAHYDRIARVEDLRSDCKDQKPIVAATVTDEEYEKYLGSTIEEFFVKSNSP
jgi:hypothetical protein